VEHGGDPERGAEPPGIAPECQQGLGRGSEQEREEASAVVQHQSPERGRQGEDDVEVRGREKARVVCSAKISLTRRPVPYAVMRIARCLGECAAASRRSTSAVLRMVGSRSGTRRRGMRAATGGRSRVMS